MTLQPAALPRRSFVYRELVALGATFREANGCAAAATLAPGLASEIGVAREMGLADLSPLRRGGYKGWTALDWLRGQGAAIGENNTAVLQPDGSRLARLADSEALILGDLRGGSALLDRVEKVWSLDAAVGAYPVPRADTNFWFAITGRCADQMLAKISGVDMRAGKFPDGSVAQTSVARMSAIIIRHDQGRTLAYDMIADSAAASYMWTSLLDAMDEFGGRPVGLDAVAALAGEAART
jgi:sarcosine oxidase subunit gamma